MYRFKGSSTVAPLPDAAKCIMRRYGMNKGACFLTLGLIFLVFLLLHNMLAVPTVGDDPAFVPDHELNYGIIIDAGSTGSRLFLYGWQSKSENELIDIRAVNDRRNKPVVKKVSPGLSSFANNPGGAAEYFRPLLEYAGSFINPEKHPSTPVFIFATAGMRLLSLDKQHDIMKSLHENLPTITKFYINPDNIKVISGQWEGIYSWIGVNYMLGRFVALDRSGDKKKVSLDESQQRPPDTKRPSTVGMIDMGGASIQIAFELPVDNKFANENVELVNLGSRDEDKRFLYQIFVTTFLGFGANEGSKKYERFLASKLDDSQQSKPNATPVQYVRDGCLPLNFMKLVSKDDGSQFVRKGTGNWNSCVDNLAQLLFKSPGQPACSPGQSCFFGGVVAPPVSLSEVELYGFSEYWYSADDVFSLGGRYDHDRFEKIAHEFCAQRWTSIQAKARTKLYPKADEDRLETQCFKSAWIHAVLHNGFFVSERQNHFQSVFKIKGEEVQWALGAMIYQMRHGPIAAAGSSYIPTRIGDDSTGWTFFYLLAIIVLIVGLYVVLFRRYWMPTGRYERRGSGLRRDNSIWGYMMLSQQEQAQCNGSQSFVASSNSYKLSQLSV